MFNLMGQRRAPDSLEVQISPLNDVGCPACRVRTGIANRCPSLRYDESPQIEVLSQPDHPQPFQEGSAKQAMPIAELNLVGRPLSSEGEAAPNIENSQEDAAVVPTS